MSSEQFNTPRPFDFATPGQPAANGMVSSALIAPLEASRIWALTSAVTGTVVTGLLLLCFSIIAYFGWTVNLEESLVVLLVGVPLTLLLCGIPSWQLYRFGSAVGSLVVQRSVSQFEAVLEAQRKFWRYLGGICLVIAVLMGLSLGLMILRLVIGAAVI